MMITKGQMRFVTLYIRYSVVIHVVFDVVHLATYLLIQIEYWVRLVATMHKVFAIGTSTLKIWICPQCTHKQC